MKKINAIVVDSNDISVTAATRERSIDLGDSVHIESSSPMLAGKVTSVSQLYLEDLLDKYSISDDQQNELKDAITAGDNRSIVTLITIVKNPETKELNVVNEATDYSEIKLYTDGGSRGNPGPSATGVALLTMDDELIRSEGTYLGVTTNNQAEYKAVLEGLEIAYELGAKKVHVLMDSLLVVNQMNGIFKIKNPDLLIINRLIREKITIFDRVTFKHVPRALNKLADAAVNKVLDNQ